MLVVAAGGPAIVTAEMVKPGAAVVDVGINRTEERASSATSIRRGPRSPGLPDSGARRSRPDDDRDASSRTPCAARALAGARRVTAARMS